MIERIRLEAIAAELEPCEVRVAEAWAAYSARRGAQGGPAEFDALVKVVKETNDRIVAKLSEIATCTRQSEEALRQNFAPSSPVALWFSARTPSAFIRALASRLPEG